MPVMINKSGRTVPVYHSINGEKIGDLYTNELWIAPDVGVQGDEIGCTFYSASLGWTQYGVIQNLSSYTDVMTSAFTSSYDYGYLSVAGVSGYRFRVRNTSSVLQCGGVRWGSAAAGTEILHSGSSKTDLETSCWWDGSTGDNLTCTAVKSTSGTWYAVDKNVGYGFIDLGMYASRTMSHQINVYGNW